MPGETESTSKARGSTGTIPARADDAIIRIERQVALLLRRAERSQRTSVLSGTLERSAYLVLDILAETGPENVNSIAEQLRLDGSTVTRQVLAMERNGHVHRRRDPSDRRATLVEPTPEGLAELAHTRERRADLYRHLVGGWDAPDLETFARLLARLNEDLDVLAR
jgi:DNA-binding MarR family transcriptional regulator